MDNLQIGGYRFDPDLAMHYGEKLAIVIGILLVTWVAAKIAKWAFAKAVDKIEFLQRDTGSGESVGASLGKIVKLLIWLFGLVAILNVLNLGNVTGPVQQLLNNVMGFIPRLIGAGIIFFVGSMIAKIVRDIVETALSAVNFDKWANKGGAEEVTGNATISKTIATVVYVLIMIPVAIGALQALAITAISDPLVGMLDTILHAIPNIVGAAILLGLGYMIGKWVAGLVEEILPGLGVNRSVSALGVLPAGVTASGVVAKIAMIAIMLVSAIAATRLLNFPELTALVTQVVEIGGGVIFGGVIIAVGFLLANLLSNLFAAGGGTAASVIKYATMFLFAFIGLREMNIGNEIVEMAFGALVIGGAAAAALAFGLGGKDAAARKLAELEGGEKPATPAKKPAAKKPAAPAE